MDGRLKVIALTNSNATNARRPLRLSSQHFLLPKSEQTLAECEDAIGINLEAGRFAVADGATEAFNARSWAKRLAEGFVRAETHALTAEDFRAWVEGEGKSLHDSWSGLRLSWYAEEKASHGSFAAFVGIEFNLEAGRNLWRAVALGDSCLIYRRASGDLSAWPITDHRAFNAAPVLVPSLYAMQEGALSQTLFSSATCGAGDVFLLLSDAASAWYLMLSEDGDNVRRAEFESLLTASRDEELARLFAAERSANRMKDDDIAIIRIEIAGE